jgi:hypothetical protein
LTEAEALSHECYLIGLYGNRNQEGGLLTANSTDGGEGVKGLKRTKDDRDNMSRIARERNAAAALVARQKARARQTAKDHGIPVELYLGMSHVGKQKAVRRAKNFGHWQAEGTTNQQRGRMRTEAKAAQLCVPVHVYESLSACARNTLATRNKRYGLVGEALLTMVPKAGPINPELQRLAIFALNRGK